ncbi:aldo-keto reductase family 1 member B1-like [Thrips palmi]|uniref:Aldo-keto reductase family 1 member B1-like n=1 Tax=Thrips palmi TaxID=161013 RepID=A0A6P8YYJ4_THRPL|nr:aldo-keto reductase family 1 member B1-like [Thrips palmi]
MVKLAPTIKLNNGQDFPILGLGTWKSKPGEVEQAVKDAIDAGYRHIDGAFIYGNEAEVGNGIRAKIAEGVVKREDIFLTSKLWNTFHRPDLVVDACKKSLKNFGLDYLDLYLIHWPTGYEEGGELFPREADGTVRYSDVDYVDTWKALEKCVELGLVKGIGLSNFNSQQVTRVLEVCKIKPLVNQVECHAHLNQAKLIKFCKERDIVVTAYSPLGSPDRPWAKPGDPMLLEDPKIKAMADKYGKTTAQVVLRYLIQHGTVPVPKSVTKSRIVSNFQVFDFELSPADVAVMDTFDCNGRLVPLNDGKKHKYWPFGIEY